MNMKAICMGVVLAVAVGTTYAQTNKPAETAQKPKAEPQLVPVAILDYEMKVPGNEELGSQLADIMTARLSIEDSICLVERAKLGKIIEEHKLKLTGIVDQDSAVKVGKLIGAKLMVMGKGFIMDKKLFLVTKVVGVETGLVKGTIRTVPLDKPMSEAIMLLSEDVAALINQNAGKLLPKGTEVIDPVADIKKALGKRPRPVVAVVVSEEHIEHDTPRVIRDPAVETEIKKTLVECGFKVVEVGQNKLADWVKKKMKSSGESWPESLEKADIVIVGEAFSEFALRSGDLVTCTGRAEINVIDRTSGEVLLADRQTQRAVDLAPDTAGKTALQNAGRKLAVQICKELVKYKPSEKKDDSQKAGTEE